MPCIQLVVLGAVAARFVAAGKGVVRGNSTGGRGKNKAKKKPTKPRQRAVEWKGLAEAFEAF